MVGDFSWYKNAAIFFIIFLPIFKGICKKLATWSLIKILSCQVISLSSQGLGSNGSQQPVGLIVFIMVNG